MGFLGISDESPGKRFAVFLFSSHDAQTHRIAAQLDVKGVPIIKKANLIRKVLSFGPKEVEKMGFLGFSVKTPGKRFAILLFSSDDAKIYRIAAQLNLKGVPIIRKAHLIGKKLRYWPKNVEKTVFFGFSDEAPGKQFAVFLYSSDDSQTYKIAALSDIRGLPIIKKANLIRKKLRYGPKKRRKNGFLGFSVRTPRKRFAILLFSSDDAKIYRIAAQLDLKGVPIIKKAHLIRKKLRYGPKNVEKKVFFWVFR